MNVLNGFQNLSLPLGFIVFEAESKALPLQVTSHVLDG